MHVLRSFFVGPAAKGLVALGVMLAWLLVVIQPAAADTITFTGQGTNANGTCGQFEGTPPQPGGTQTWQFNLTQTDSGATMSATFSDGTSVTNIPENTHNGSTSMWFITTAAGASVTSASATFTPSGPNPQFVVSHCTAGGSPPPTTSPTTPTTRPTAPTTSPSAPTTGPPGAGTTTQPGVSPAGAAATPVVSVPTQTG
ncbi:MAG TPA: hypothetical protein VFA62_06120 [Acidimicrobiia bacterium]|nr:hypothetical protein [Acidimicrobiia bacterium]